jgi:hypothetical protein
MRTSTITFLSVGMCVGVILFRLKYEVLGLEQTHQQIKKSIFDTKEAIHVLRAEWAHLSDPSRIQKLSIKYLNNGQPLNFKPVKLDINQQQKKLDKKNDFSKTENIQKQGKENAETLLTEKDSLDVLFETAPPSLKVKNIGFEVQKRKP